jgi:hypothetical protein
VSATPAEAGCAAATCLMDWFTSTNELHECIYAPYGRSRPARSWQLFGVSADTPVWLKRLAVAAGQSAKQ